MCYVNQHENFNNFVCNQTEISSNESILDISPLLSWKQNLPRDKVHQQSPRAYSLCKRGTSKLHKV